MERLRIMILIGAFCALGCQRDMSGGKSSITIRVPEAHNKLSKTGGVGAMAAMPSNRKACYGINVTGPGIPINSASCGPQSGILAGFVEPGATVEVSVPKGEGRTIELYAYLQNVGDNLPCPALGASLPAAHLLNTYSVGTATNVAMTAESTVVYIDASFPGVTNHLASTLSLPSTCTAGASPTGPNKAGFQVAASAGMSWTQGQTPATAPVRLLARVGSNIPKVQLQSGSGVKLKVK